MRLKAEGGKRRGTFEPLLAGHRQSGASVAKSAQICRKAIFVVSLS
jgi:hypothetical protein